MKSLLTVVEQVYHQQAGGQPNAAVTRYSLASSDEEQVYERRFALPGGAEWLPIDAGWLAGRKVSLLLLANVEGHDATTIPTPEQKAGVAARVVELTFGDEADVFVPPGESCRLRPADLSRVRLRCPGGSARVVLTIYP